MANVKTFLLEVDLYRNGFVFRSHSDRLYERNTLGRYYVGAKNPKKSKNYFTESYRLWFYYGTKPSVYS